jgi:ABC-type multidrug transport system fused ATPase/permease subunit
LALSPELRRGLPVTLLLALVATAGRVIVPIAIQQVIDGGLGDDGVDMNFTWRMVGLAAAAVVVTSLATSGMHLRLAVVSENSLSRLRIRVSDQAAVGSLAYPATPTQGFAAVLVNHDDHYMLVGEPFVIES